MKNKKDVKINITMRMLAGIVFMLSAFYIAAPMITHAQNSYDKFQDAPKPIIKLEIPINGITQVSGLSEYIKLLYTFGVSSIGIAATIMIMWGGIKWIVAGGNSGKIGDAKDTIVNAIIGLILALLSYTLLYVINPALVNINDGTIKAIPVSKRLDLLALQDCAKVAADGTRCKDNKELVCGQPCTYDGKKQCVSMYCADSKTTCALNTTSGKCVKPECKEQYDSCYAVAKGQTSSAEYYNCLCKFYNKKNNQGCSSTDPCNFGILQNCQTQDYGNTDNQQRFCVGKASVTSLCSGVAEGKTCDVVSAPPQTNVATRTCQGGQCKLCLAEGEEHCTSSPTNTCCEGLVCTSDWLHADKCQRVAP